ncbi:MAG: TraR/DksA family transcriptional regulator [Treponema sp.]|nr:TraR/DksA family transcriptional regulator [Treponema sp.]
MNADFCEEQKQKLLIQRKEILESLAGRSEQLAKMVETLETGDDADIASDTIDRTLLNSLGEASAYRLQLIDGALDRIKQGKYGICLICGKEIPQARLEAIPYAGLCINCQAQEEKKNR